MRACPAGQFQGFQCQSGLERHSHARGDEAEDVYKRQNLNRADTAAAVKAAYLNATEVAAKVESAEPQITTAEADAAVSGLSLIHI